MNLFMQNFRTLVQIQQFRKLVPCIVLEKNKIKVC